MAPQATIETGLELNETVSRRTIANRLNARRSTGPKTKEGKERSRRNALKTGLAALVVVPEELRREAEGRVESWVVSYQPQDDVQKDLVARAATAMTLLDRCCKELETARLRGAMHAEGFWDRGRRTEVAEVAKKLKRAPESVVARLRMTRHGAEWLMRRWEQLGRRLERGCDWTPSQRSLALDLLGVDPELRDDHTDLDVPGAEPQVLIAHRLEVARSEIASLEADIDDFLAESDEIDRDIRMKHLVVGVDPDVRRLERYEHQLDARVHRCLKMVRQLQEARPAEPPKPEPKRPAASKPAPPPVEIRKPPEVGGPESLEYLLPSVPPVDAPIPTTTDDDVPTDEEVVRISAVLELDARNPFLSPADRAEGVAMLEAYRKSRTSS